MLPFYRYDRLAYRLVVHTHLHTNNSTKLSDVVSSLSLIPLCLLPCHSLWQMDPVQKAVINHTFGVPLVKTKRPIISCNVCQIRFNSEVQEH